MTTEAYNQIMNYNGSISICMADYADMSDLCQLNGTVRDSMQFDAEIDLNIGGVCLEFAVDCFVEYRAYHWGGDYHSPEEIDLDIVNYEVECQLIKCYDEERDYNLTEQQVLEIEDKFNKIATIWV